MKKINWELIASELTDVMLLMEEEEQVIERLLTLMTPEQLASTEWFTVEKIEEVIEYNARGLSYFDWPE